MVEISTVSRQRNVPAIDHAPGSEAPASGVYEQLNIFGTATGITERVAEGERLPLAPQGYSWRMLEREWADE